MIRTLLLPALFLLLLPLHAHAFDIRHHTHHGIYRPCTTNCGGPGPYRERML